MKRRNIDSGGKPRRSFKRCSKFTDGSSSFFGTFVYLKMIAIWCAILLADFVLEFRFEYLWPFWLLVRSISNCLKYQGMVIAIFFTCFTLVSDAICFFVIPMHMLFFLASTYVWVRYVWNADRGICMPTIALWLLFVYIEVSVRLKDLQKNCLQVDLCHPLAAHCVGYPIVALSSGFKNYVQYRMRLWKQCAVRDENEFYFELLRNALPKQEETSRETCGKDSPNSPHKEDESFGYSCGIINFPCAKKTSRQNNCNPSQTYSLESTSTYLASDVLTSGIKLRKRNSTSNLPCPPPVQSKSFPRKDHLPLPTTECKEDVKNQLFKEEFVNSDESQMTKPANAVSELPDVLTPIYDKKLQHAPKSSDSSKGHFPVIAIEKNDDAKRIEKLESIISELRSELNLTQQCEGMLRTQNLTLIKGEKSVKNELSHLRRDNEQLQSKLHNVVSIKQKDKQIMESLENQLRNEKASREFAEKTLEEERSRRNEDEARIAAFEMSNRERENEEENKKRIEHLQKECEYLNKQLVEKNEFGQKLQKEVEELKQKERTARESETLMSALTAMQEKNAMLEKSLSSETRLKLDLFSALGDVKRQLEISHSIRCQREVEIEELQARVADVLSVLPDSQTASVTPHYSATFLENRNAPQPSLRINQSQHYSQAYCPVPVTPVARQSMDPYSIIHANRVVQTSNMIGQLPLDPGVTAYASSPASSIHPQK